MIIFQEDLFVAIVPTGDGITCTGKSFSFQYLLEQ